MSRDGYRAATDCPPEWPDHWCREYATLVEGLVPSDAPGTWRLRCAHCRTVTRSGLDYFEAFALEAAAAATGVTLDCCCPCPAPAPEPTAYTRPSCPRCGLTSAHVHTCAWSP